MVSVISRGLPQWPQVISVVIAWSSVRSRLVLAAGPVRAYRGVQLIEGAAGDPLVFAGVIVAGIPAGSS